MASSILNSDDGVVSGTSGLKTSGGDDGILKIQTNGTDAVSVSGAQVCTFPNPPVMGVSGLTGDIAAARITNALNASGSAPIYACRAWVNFNGTGTVAIRASGNVTSITDNGTGDYTMNFTTAMPDTSYSVIQGAANDGGNDGNRMIRWQTFSQNTTSFRFQVAQIQSAQSNQDASNIHAAVFR
jgi:hypothetical protein